MSSEITDIAIRVEELGKRYFINHQQTGGDGLRHALQEKLTAPFRWLASGPKGDAQTTNRQLPSSEEFWALNDVSFEVKQGEVVGIIGRNGAGKSTLLKILSRITEPTRGRIIMDGRVASLLEVGTGFHPELTGRENISLNGAILGMSRADIKDKFDEIVDFAGVEKFLDTPVKRYSSGMYVRLAFAVAAHLEPEILIVDEVLAVGDAGFQKKCLGKMQDVAGQGRTVLFVSHQMSSIQRLCSRGLLLQNGNLAFAGPIREVIDEYLLSLEQLSALPLDERRDRQGAGFLRITEVEFLDEHGVSQSIVSSGEPLTVRLRIRKAPHAPSLRGARFSIDFKAHGQSLFICSTELTTDEEWIIEHDTFVDCTIPRLPLSNGRYQVTLYAEAMAAPQDWIDDAAILEVEGGAFFAHGRQTVPGNEGRNVLVDHIWTKLAVEHAGLHS